MSYGAALADADAQLGIDALADAAAAARREPDVLVDGFITDAPGAFEAVVATYEARVTRLAHRLLGWKSRADVEDVVQDVFFAAFQHRHRFAARASLGTWLTAITVNRCRSQHRRARLRRMFLWGHGRETEAPAASSGPEADEMSGKVRLAVESLPPRDREVIVLRYFEHLPAAEIAGVTKQSVNAVEVRLHRARARLADALGAWHREERS